MVSSYALGFIIPSIVTGQAAFSLSDIIGWLIVSSTSSVISLAEPTATIEYE